MATSRCLILETNMEERTSSIGGKGKGLVWLSQNIDLGFEVPRFETIDDSYYEEVIMQPHVANLVALLRKRINPEQDFSGVVKGIPKRLEERCLSLAYKFKGKELAIRSSAVMAEDNQRFSGAGRYDSFFIESKDVNPKSISQAILRVYASVDGERAVAYRKENKLNEERMAVVVQEIQRGANGVIMSRLPSRAGIIPITWSIERGAVVGGSKQNTPIHTIYYSTSGDEIFISDNLKYDDDVQRDFARERINPLVSKLRERYGVDFEAEFVVDFESKSPKINMVQIRPLTNIKDVEVKFPDKEPIFVAERCMGSGEYIGPIVFPAGRNPVRKYWDEPVHYAFAIARLDKLMPSMRDGMGSLLGKGDDYAQDFDKLTPNKKALIVTHDASPGMHALTVANEKGILCLAKDNPEMSNSKFQATYSYSKGSFLAASGIAGLVDFPKFDVPYEEIGRYVHVVSNGLEGRVYRATEAEADEFARKMLSSVSYKVDFEPHDEHDKWWDYRLTIVPSNLGLIPLIANDFLQHIQERCHKEFYEDSSPAGNSRSLMCDGAEFEVFCSWYNPDKRSEGISLSSGRSTYEVAKKQEVKQWFEQFVAKYTQGYVPKQD